jgi:DNA-3-methyladenine glycosylase I
MNKSKAQAKPTCTKPRCQWVNLKNPLYVAYHDHEWGEPVYDDRQHFELLILEGAQAGLSWETVLNKRDKYRKLFANFDPNKVAKFNITKLQALLQDPGIIRNRLKIESAVINAKAFLKVQAEYGSFNDYIWSFVGNKPLVNAFKTVKDYPSKTELSDRTATNLKRLGFKFVGSTIIYAYLQAAGLVNDHTQGCWKHQTYKFNATLV